MRTPARQLFLCLCLLLAACAPAALPAPTTILTKTMTPETSHLTPDTSTPTPDAFAALKALGRGINMGNALEAPNEGEWGVTLRPEYFDRIRQAGFQSVRLPVSWSAHAALQPPYAIDPVFMARVDDVLSWALAKDLHVILDFHNYDALMNDPQGQSARYLAIWQQVAAHYSTYPDALLFELLNEPYKNLDAAAWNRLLAQALAQVRASNPLRTMVVGGPLWNAYDQLGALELPAADRNIIATFHYYNPFPFTHQGAEWVDGSAAYMGTTWQGSPAERAEIAAHFDQVAAWSRAQQRPVLLGEFGAYSKADMDSRARWTDAVAREAEKRGFAWSYWEFCAGFGAYDPAAKVWREPLLKALNP